MIDAAAILPMIRSYQGYVADAIRRFRNLGIQGNILAAWKRSHPRFRTTLEENADPMLPQQGFLDAGQSIRYKFHGIGCRVHFGSTVVDFDFGPDGRYDGFDAWRLSQFGRSVPEFHAFGEYEIVQPYLNALESAGQIERSAFGSALYYFVDSTAE